jgi:SAM-dependent methyltransferase
MSLDIQDVAYWDGAVESYEASAEPFTGLFCADAVALAEVEHGMMLLDVATGPGALALAAERAGAVVTAIDFAQAMVDRLAVRSAGRRIEARRMDGQALDLPDGQFDRACSVFGVPLFPDWRAGLREMARVLKPGGLAVVATASTPVGFGPYMMLADLREALFPGQPAIGGPEGMAALAGRDRLAQAMRDAGFAEVVVHDRSHCFAFPAAIFETARDMLHASPAIADLAASERDLLLDRAAAVAAAEQRDGKLELLCTAYLAVARR